MRSWAKDSAAVLGICVLAIAGGAWAQKTAAKKAAAHRANELTLARLQPGKDSLARAAEVNRKFGTGKELQGEQTGWFDLCRDLSLTIDSNKEAEIQVIRLAEWSGSTADSTNLLPGPWQTGLGLRVGDSAAKVAELYGNRIRGVLARRAGSR